MHVPKAINFVVVVIAVISATVFNGRNDAGNAQQSHGVQNRETYQDRRDRYPVVDAEQPESSDLAKKAKLQKLKQRYDYEAPFTNPGPKDEELAFRAEWQFNFPALPVVKSDVIVLGQVLSAEAHRSNNKMNVFRISKCE